MAFKTRQQLADEFGISVRTLYRWLTKWNVKLPGGLIRPADQDAIYQKLEQSRFDAPESPGGKRSSAAATSDSKGFKKK